MDNLNDDEYKMEKALKRQLDWVLQLLGLEIDTVQIPKSNRVEEEKGRGEGSRLKTPRQCNHHNGERRTRSGGITGSWNNRGNNGNNGNYGNNGNENNGNGNANNQNGGGGNDGNNGNNGGNGNYQNNNYGCKPPMTIERKTHYEILSHKPTTLQQAFKTITTIENNRKAAGRIGRRDDPKLYNPRATKKNEFSQIMDMLKDRKGKENHNEKPPPYRSNKPMNYNRPILHDMPYNTNWKDGKPMNVNLSKETSEPLKKVNNFVEEYPWCEFCNLPHVVEQCMIAQGLVEENDHEDEYEPTVNALLLDPCWGWDEDSFEDEVIRCAMEEREPIVQRTTSFH
ncbi:uncharacterized protein LOC131856306 [Cryptomeria japonica]|uniref:uncharacterized protein LOC131856306 n=1 Tax=Cryptomeria japonica TaxID=3369 RepID=UPI0027DA1778|nr:uncharacterized protein LOC131856306 [Cryptomeria japonica]